METLKASTLAYISHFQMADYIAFAWLILLFFIALFMAILLAKKHPILAIFILFFDLILLVAGPFAIKMILDSYLRQTHIELTTTQQLIYSDTLIIQGNLHHQGKIDFTQCSINAYLLPQDDGTLLSSMKTLKPLRQTSISLETPPAKGEHIFFELVWENIRLGEEQNLSVKGECY